MNKEKCVMCGVAILINVTFFLAVLIVTIKYA
jgi:hypothetical protein